MGKIRNIVFPLFALMILLAGCNPTANEETVLYNDLDQYFSTQFPKDEPGGAVLVMRGDTILFSKGYGLADMTSKEPITTSTLFNLGSVSKTFVANAILMLHHQGKLSLEDNLWTFFPEFKSKSVAQKVKIRHLLTHTSGIPDSRNVASDTDFYLYAKDAENWAPILQTDTLLFEPGAEFDYSNPAFNGLALIIEKASGMQWQEYVRKNIFVPSLMKTSTITDGAHPAHGVSHGYVNEAGKWAELDYGEEPTFPAAGNGGVWSSVEELAQYEKAMHASVFLPDSVIADARHVKKFDNWKGTRPFTSGWSWFKPGLDNGVMQPLTGWSWFVGTDPGGRQVIGHTGTQGGFMANYVTIPAQKIFIVVLVNTPRDIFTFTDTIVSKLPR